jgi:hypothetical protein
MFIKNLDDCFIIAKGNNEMYELLAAIKNATSIDELEEAEQFWYLDDVICEYRNDLESLKENAAQVYQEYK